MNAAVGNALWRILHAYALQYPEIADDAARAGAVQWLAAWGKIVEDNSTGCSSCHRKWCLLVERQPPSLAGREAFHNWTVAAHDWINREMGKARFDTAISLHHANFGLKLPNGEKGQRNGHGGPRLLGFRGRGQGRDEDRAANGDVPA